ncbi:carbohydrate ABC transporter permease [Paenibacillus sp. SAF-054]|uniref:carbohydrate ABC transporter permease n=1 Tax=unclassified Paenibacillus TaxID=185978 RepID=UPI003F81CFCB
MRTRLKLSSSTLRNLEGIIFILPWVLGFLFFVAFPMAYSLYYSTNNVKFEVGKLITTPVGFDNYKQILFKDGSLLYNDLFPFMKQAVMMIPIIVVFALMIGILLNQPFRGRTFFRAIFFLPVIFSTGPLITEFMNQDQGGLSFLEQYQVAEFVQANLPSSWAVPIMNVLEQFVLVLWYSGVQILIFIAGRQTISPVIYEAARIDGAGPWEMFWKITLPGMVPFILLNTIYTTVDLFTFPTNPILMKFNATAYGFSSALIWIYFSIIFAFIMIIFGIFALIMRRVGGR